MQVEIDSRKEAQHKSADKGEEDAKLSCRTEQQRFWIRYEWTKVGHRTHSHEDEDGEQTGLDAHVIEQFDEARIASRARGVDTCDIGERDIG